mgnify:CR=1 FL=1
MKASSLCKIILIDWQASNPLAGCRKEGIAEGGGKGWDSWLTNTAGRRVTLDERYVDLCFCIRDSCYRCVVEIALFNGTFLHGCLAHHGQGNAKNNRSFHLTADPFRVHCQTTVDSKVHLLSLAAACAALMLCS